MKYFFVSFLSLLIAACSGSSDNKSGPGSLGQPSKATNQTDYSNCGGPTPPGFNLESTIWGMHFAADAGFEMLMTIQADNGYVYMSNECSMNGYSITASVSSPASYRNNMLSIFQDQQNSQTLSENGTELNCHASISRSNSHYSFRGKCLVIEDGASGESATFVPLR